MVGERFLSPTQLLYQIGNLLDGGADETGFLASGLAFGGKQADFADTVNLGNP